MELSTGGIIALLVFVLLVNAFASRFPDNKAGRVIVSVLTILALALVIVAKFTFLYSAWGGR